MSRSTADDCEYDSSGSSSATTTVLNYSNSCSMSEASSGACPGRTSSPAPTSTEAVASGRSLHPIPAPTANKPHKANQAAWEAMKRLSSNSAIGGGRVGLEHFHLLRRVGTGDIGSVYLCRLRYPVTPSSSTCLYAMKVVDREAVAHRNKLQRAEMEKEILVTLDHPFLPTLYAHFDTSHYSCLVMEYCPGGDLHAVRQRQPHRRFTLSSAKFYAAEVLLALEYLHMMGIIYRDLKPENVLVREDGHIMLSDFDLALKCDVVPTVDLKPKPSQEETLSKGNPYPCVLPMQPVISCFKATKGGGDGTVRVKSKNPKKSGSKSVNVASNDNAVLESDPELVAEPTNARSKSFVGTHEYLAPEVIAGSGHGSAVDWWTFGVFLYEMLYGRTPFRGENNEATLMNIIKKPLVFPRIVSVQESSEEMMKAQELISRLLTKNPKKRIGFLKGSAEIKRHEFFKGMKWALIRTMVPPQVPTTTTESSAINKKMEIRKIQPYPKKNDCIHKAAYNSRPTHFDYF